MNNNGKILMALLGGAAIGAALGILFAPDKGVETRKKVVDATKDLADKLKEKIKDGMKPSSNGVKEEANEFTS